MNSRLLQKISISVFVLATSILAPLAVFAGPLKSSIAGLSLVGKEGGLSKGPASSSTLPTLIGNLISVTLAVVGIVFVVLIVQSGIEYMTSAGAEDKVKTAKKRIVSSVIGIVIVLAAYSISSFVITAVSNVTESSTATSSSQSSDEADAGASKFLQPPPKVGGGMIPAL